MPFAFFDVAFMTLAALLMNPEGNAPSRANSSTGFEENFRRWLSLLAILDLAAQPRPGIGPLLVSLCA